MRLSVLTVFSKIYESFLQTSLVKRAQDNDIVSFDICEYFSFCKPKERIDATTFGHGTGMVIKPKVVEKAIESQEKKHGKSFKVFLSPQGKKFDQTLAKKIFDKAQESGHLLLVTSRYEGMDSRVEDYYADETISVGDFVLMGGDIPAMMVIETIMRFLPGVVGKQESVENESFSGPFVDYPQFSVPVKWKGFEVPEIVRSGDHGKVSQWRQEQAAEKTVLHHFQWLRSYPADKKQKDLAEKFIPSHYVVLMHDQIALEKGRVGTTSVASLDIHDIARSARTYNLKNYFMVTPLVDQQKIIKKILGFWDSDVGRKYNQNRHDAISRVIVTDSLDDVVKQIKKKEGKKPLLIATSARKLEECQESITYYDQEKIWDKQRPILFLLGTGRGLSEAIVKGCDYLLLPIEGFSSFNHLSVRSAAAIIFDRWLGVNPKDTKG